MFKIGIKIFLTLNLLPLFVEAIIGGSFAKPHEYPWIVGVVDNSGKCGGTIISKNLVITAAHCVDHIDKYYNDELFIQMGQSDLKSSLIKKEKVESILIHPQYIDMSHSYNRSTRTYEQTFDYNDIALLRLSKDIEFNHYFVEPIALPNEGILDDYDGLMIAAGWGFSLDLTNEIDFFKNQSILVKEKQEFIIQRAADPHNLMKLKMIFNTECTTTSAIGHNEFCAAGRKQPIIEGTCNGDSGSPLMTKRNGRIEIIGIASKSHCFGSDNIFVNVGRFTTWIHKNLEKFVDPYLNLENSMVNQSHHI